MDGRSKTSAENGRKGGRPVLEATKLREALIRELEKNAEPLARKLVEKALTGDVPALREAYDRGIGKPLQQLDHTTNGKDMPTPIIQLPKD